MLGSITARQWQEWQEFADLEPFGGVQDDLRACVTAIFARLAFSSSDLSPLEFFPELKRLSSREQTPEEMAEIARQWAARDARTRGRR